MSSLVVWGAAQNVGSKQAIESFRREEAVLQTKDKLTDVFVNGPSLENQDLYTDPEEIAKSVMSISTSLTRTH